MRLCFQAPENNDSGIDHLEPVLRGWFEYFKQNNQYTLQEVDGWVRGHLRSILRKRHKGKGKARGKDHFKWPNRYAKLGLFTLETAWADARKSLRCNH